MGEICEICGKNEAECFIPLIDAKGIEIEGAPFVTVCIDCAHERSGFC